MNIPILANVDIPSSSFPFSFKLVILVLVAKFHHIFGILTQTPLRIGHLAVKVVHLFFFLIVCSVLRLQIFNLLHAKGSASDAGAVLEILGILVQTSPEQKLIDGSIPIIRTLGFNASPWAVLVRSLSHVVGNVEGRGSDRWSARRSTVLRKKIRLASRCSSSIDILPLGRGK